MSVQPGWGRRRDGREKEAAVAARSGPVLWDQVEGKAVSPYPPPADIGPLKEGACEAGAEAGLERSVSRSRKGFVHC